jgi:predicted ATPase with chaperone activity
MFVIVKTARTIADLKGEGDISKQDIREAVSFKNFDR